MTMPERWRRTFAAYAMTPEHRQRRVEALGAIRSAFFRSSRPYVAFSGGKDSTVLAHLVLRDHPDTMVYHWDFGPDYMPRVLEAEVDRNARLLRAWNYRVDTSSKYLTGHDGPVWYREHFGRVEPELLAEGYTMVFVGIRSQESGKRRRRIQTGEAIGKMPECWPLTEWSWLDVWAEIVANDLPYPSIYDERAAIVGYDQARFTTFFDPEMDKYSANTVDGLTAWRLRGR